MPTYEYRCPNDHAFEVFQKISAEPRAACPECGEDAERQISGGAGFLFKGEGFYITDYRSEEYRKKAKAEKSGGAKKGAGAEDGGGSGGDGGSKGSSSTGDTSSTGGAESAS